MSTYRLNDGQYLGTVGDPAEMSKLERTIRDFDDYYKRLTSVRYGAKIGRLAGTPEGNTLNREYGEQLARAESTKRRIESVLGAWDSVKGAVGLAALPLIPIAVAIGLTAAIAGAVQTGRAWMRRTDIRLAMQATPELSYEEAAAIVDAQSKGSLEKAIDAAQIGISAFVIWMVFKYLKG